MRISGLCLLISAFILAVAGFSKYGQYLSQNTISMMVLLAVAIGCLGTLELKLHRRSKSEQRRSATTLASALRNGALR